MIQLHLRPPETLPYSQKVYKWRLKYASAIIAKSPEDEVYMEKRISNANKFFFQNLADNFYTSKSDLMEILLLK